MDIVPEHRARDEHLEADTNLTVVDANRVPLACGNGGVRRQSIPLLLSERLAEISNDVVNVIRGQQQGQRAAQLCRGDRERIRVEDLRVSGQGPAP